MRTDMSKVITERPRWGHSMPSRKTGARIKPRDAEHEYEDQPKRLPIWWSSDGKSGEKEFSDRLGPLRRYLRRNVGRPWDKVFSELKDHLDTRSVTGRHVFQHIETEVKRDCYIGKDGKVYVRYFRGHPVRVFGLFVHPRTGLLCWKEGNYWRNRLGGEKKKKEIAKIRIDDTRSYLKKDGIWYIAEYAPCETRTFAGKVVEPPDGYKVGKQWMGLVRKKQCSKAELKAAGLSNDDLN